MNSPVQKTRTMTLDMWVELNKLIHDNRFDSSRLHEKWQGYELPVVAVEGYLIAAKLHDAIKQALPPDVSIAREVTIPGTRFRHDFVLYDATLQQTKAIEFDGPQHYRDPETIQRDKRKDALCEERGIKVIRFPYWLQLTTQTAIMKLGLNFFVDQDFPHGFITTKWRPESFCKEGVERYEKELSELPRNIREAVLESLTRPPVKDYRPFAKPSGSKMYW